jgi:hypothetical protein
MGATHMDFMEFHRYEMDALKPSAFEKWAARVEKILGYDLDGDQQRDGYSLDYSLMAFERGDTAKEYAERVHAGRSVRA